jgi:hypothetical protein
MRLLRLLALAGCAALIAALFFWPNLRAQTNVTFYYVVKSVDANGKTSAPSNEATAVVPAADDHVNLSWTASVPGSDTAVGYYIYRGTTSGGESSTPLNSTAVTAVTYTDAIPIPNPPAGLAATPAP